MNLDTLLGIDDNDPMDRHADYIVSADENLMRDLVSRRKELGLSQQQVADRMGINKSNVSRIERGDGDLLQSTLRRYIMALDAVVIHEVRAFHDVDGATKARHYLTKSSYERSTTRAMPIRPTAPVDERSRILVAST